MAGIFKSLDKSDVRITPFRAYKLWAENVSYRISSPSGSVPYYPVQLLTTNNVNSTGSVETPIRDRYFYTLYEDGTITKVDTQNSYTAVSRTIPSASTSYPVQMNLIPYWRGDTIITWGYNVPPSASASATQIKIDFRNAYSLAIRINNPLVLAQPSFSSTAFQVDVGQNPLAFGQGGDGAWNSSPYSSSVTSTWVYLGTDAGMYFARILPVGTSTSAGGSYPYTANTLYQFNLINNSGSYQAFDSVNAPATAKILSVFEGTDNLFYMAFQPLQYSGSQPAASGWPNYSERYLFNGQSGTATAKKVYSMAASGSINTAVSIFSQTTSGSIWTLFDDGNLWHMRDYPGDSQRLLQTNIYDIAYDYDAKYWSNFPDATGTPQAPVNLNRGTIPTTRKLFAVTKGGTVYANVRATSDNKFTYDRIIDCSQYVGAGKAVCKVVGNKNTPNPKIGIYATGSTGQGVFFTINTTNYTVSDPIPLGANDNMVFAGDFVPNQLYGVRTRLSGSAIVDYTGSYVYNTFYKFDI